jgi:hypothetical protein
MKRVLAAAAVAVSTLAIVPGPASGSHASGTGESRDFAVGGGTTGTPSDPTAVQHVDFAASGGPTSFDPFSGFGGDPVTGHFRAGGAFDQLGITEFQQEGPVTCLVVQGSRAQLVYANKQATPAEPLASLEVLIFLEDNGPPVNGESTDEIGFVLLPDEDPDDDPPTEQDSECASPSVAPTMFTLEKGDLTVHDAP